MNLKSTWSLSADHPCLPGHFPGQPIVPGVVLLAEVARLARQEFGLGDAPFSWQRIKFLAPVEPNQVVTIGLDGNADRFAFHIVDAQGGTIARGQARHDPLA